MNDSTQDGGLQGKGPTPGTPEDRSPPSTFHCQGCGKCCVNNGLIPPLLYQFEGDPDAPEWLVVLVDRLRHNFASIAEEYHCVFLTDDMRCAIHDVCKPGVCRDFECTPESGGHSE